MAQMKVFKIILKSSTGLQVRGKIIKLFKEDKGLSFCKSGLGMVS